MRTFSRKNLIPSATTILALAVGGVSGAYAQQSDKPAIQGGLEELVVTARKREETLQEAPVTVAVFSKESIERYDVTSLERLASVAPQFFVGRASNGSGAQITLRGIGTSSTSIGVEQSVAVIVDNVYYGQGRVLNEGMFDMQQIEMLKGPQALFFGKNATAGVVSLTSAKPAEEFEVMARIGREFEADEMRYEGYVTGPITDTLRARLAVRHYNATGSLFKDVSTDQPWGALDTGDFTGFSLISPANKGDFPGNKESMGRLSIAWDPTEDLSMTLSYQMTDSQLDNSSFNYTHFNCPGGMSQGTAGLKCGNNFKISQNYFPAEIAATLPYAKKDGSNYNDYESWSLTHNLSWNFGNFTLTSTANMQKNEDQWACACDYQSWPNAVHATEYSKWKAWSEEIRISTDFDGMLNAMVGFLYQDTEREFLQWFAFAGLRDTVNAPAPSEVYTANSKASTTDGKTFSPFFQLIFTPRDDLEITAGARYTDEKKDSWFVHPYMNLGVQGLWVMGQDVYADQKFDDWSPEATARWSVTDNTSVYLSYKTAYKSGGFSNSGLLSQPTLGGSVNDFLFEPETVKGYEFGVKSTLLDNQMRLSFTAYKYDYKNLQVDFFNAPVFQFITLNAGKSETKGFEFEGEYAPYSLAGLRLHGSIAYNKSKYQDFISPCWTGQTAAQGCNQEVPGTGSPDLGLPGAPGQDISGFSTAMAPKWAGSVGGSYDRQLDNGMSIGVAVDGVYSGKYNASGFGNPHSARDSYMMWHANAYLAGADDRWQLMLMGRNLGNEHVITGVVDGPSTGVPGSFSDQLGFTANPRTVALQLTVRYR